MALSHLAHRFDSRQFLDLFLLSLSYSLLFLSSPCLCLGPLYFVVTKAPFTPPHIPYRTSTSYHHSNCYLRYKRLQLALHIYCTFRRYILAHRRNSRRECRSSRLLDTHMLRNILPSRTSRNNIRHHFCIASPRGNNTCTVQCLGQSPCRLFQ